MQGATALSEVMFSLTLEYVEGGLLMNQWLSLYETVGSFGLVGTVYAQD